MKKEVEIFIIPNPILWNKEIISEESASRFREHQVKLWGQWYDFPEDLVPDLSSKDQGMIEIWGVIPGDKEDSNFTSHRGELQEFLEHDKNEEKIRFSNYWPVKWFIDMKEGETVDISLKDGNVLSCTLRQKKYRYRNHGTFEEVLESLL